MATAVAQRRAPVLGGGYRRILVPLVGGPAAARAFDAACRLAAERRASVTAMAVIRVPPLLPLDSRMDDEEAEARAALDLAETIAGEYGVTFRRRQARVRDVAAAVLDAADDTAAELVVLAAARVERSNRRATPFDRVAQQILRKAQCRVLVLALTV